MSGQIDDVPPSFTPLIKLNLPSPEEYRKRKVALISGMSIPLPWAVPPMIDLHLDMVLQVSLAKMDLTCEFAFYLSRRIRNCLVRQCSPTLSRVTDAVSIGGIEATL